jgi:hypothetical protein
MGGWEDRGMEHRIGFLKKKNPTFARPFLLTQLL